MNFQLTQLSLGQELLQKFEVVGQVAVLQSRIQPHLRPQMQDAVGINPASSFLLFLV